MNQEKIDKILDDLDTLKWAVHDTMDGFEAENMHEYDMMFNAIARQIDNLLE